MGHKVRCGTFFRDLCITIEKTDEISVYLLLTEEEDDLKERLVITRSKSIFVGVRKLCFICNEYRESDCNAYNCVGLARRCEQGARCNMLDRMNVFLQDPATKFHEAATRLYMKIGYEAHNIFVADIYYHNSY